MYNRIRYKDFDRLIFRCPRVRIGMAVEERFDYLGFMCRSEPIYRRVSGYAVSRRVTRFMYVLVEADLSKWFL